MTHNVNDWKKTQLTKIRSMIIIKNCKDLRQFFQKIYMFVFSWISMRIILFNTLFYFIFGGHICLLTHGSPWEKNKTISMNLKMTFYYKCVSFHVIPWDILCVLEDKKRILHVFFLIDFCEKYFFRDIIILKKTKLDTWQCALGQVDNVDLNIGLMHNYKFGNLAMCNFMVMCTFMECAHRN
jgi:hypothetical protein